MDYIHGSKMPVWVTASERYLRLEKLGLARTYMSDDPAKARERISQQSFVAKQAYFHPFLSKLYHFCQDNTSVHATVTQEDEETFFFECIRKWLEEDPDFENVYGLWEIAQDGTERVSFMGLKTRKVQPQMINTTIQGYAPMPMPTGIVDFIDFSYGDGKLKSLATEWLKKKV